ncbi:unnamed protein product [Sphenostylis stenocarpa]|uniref:Uncharacterized protein n=1 Tax=Sphenostylis stenocarpa TaxID=92480 RepID=A0AA86SP95_9FABA|nr:unnamed protein product [Sphenostylis stenocarpa]
MRLGPMIGGGHSLQKQKNGKTHYIIVWFEVLGYYVYLSKTTVDVHACDPSWTNFVPSLTNSSSRTTLGFKKDIQVCYLTEANVTFLESSSEHSLCMRPLEAPDVSLSPISLPCMIPSTVTNRSVSYLLLVRLYAIVGRKTMVDWTRLFAAMGATSITGLSETLLISGQLVLSGDIM